jgi:hypothetical protein
LVKQLAFLLSGADVGEPELDRSMSRTIIAGYALLFHPDWLAVADFLPEIEDIINPPMGNDRVLIVADRIFQLADPVVQKDLQQDGTLLIRLREDQVTAGPASMASWNGLSTEPAELLAEFYAAGYHYLGLQILLRRLGHSEKIEEQLIWGELSQAAESYRAGEHESARSSLHAAFDVMHANRQSAYPATINWLDVVFPREKENDQPLVDRFAKPVKLNLIALPGELRSLSEQTLAELKRCVTEDEVEILGGRMSDRPFGMLPFESRAWELSESYRQLKKLLDREIDSYAGRASSLGSDLPQLLMKHGVRYAWHAALDGSRYPILRGPKIHWSTGDGSIVETLTRPPISASDEEGGLSLFVQLADLLLAERSPTTVLAHRVGSDSVWYRLLIEGQKIATVFGKFETLTEFFLNVMMPDGPTVTRPDEYRSAETSLTESRNPISTWRDLIQQRHHFDSIRSLLGLVRITDPTGPSVPAEELSRIESTIELAEESAKEDLPTLAEDAKELLIRAIGIPGEGSGGWLIVNPSSFPRRFGIEIPDRLESPDINNVLRAAEVTSTGTNLVVDLLGWSYAWIPRRGTGVGTQETLEPVARGRRLKNTQIEVEIDKKSGGIRGIWSLRDRHSRLGQVLVHSAGSEMIAREIKVDRDDRLVGVIRSVGVIRARDTKKEWATFEQSVRVWRGRPVARIDIAIEPTIPLVGNPMENYFACRWAWPDDKTVVLTSSGPTMGSHLDSCIEAADFIELREQHLATNIVTGGLVRTHRFDRQQADTLLIVPGEEGRRFSLWIAMDSPNPFRLAQAELWPALVTPVAGGVPTRGPTGTLAKFTSDTAHATSLVPMDSPKPGVRIRLAETMGKGGRFPLDFHRRPDSVLLTNFLGETIYDLYREETQVSVDLAPLEMQQVLALFETTDSAAS